MEAHEITPSYFTLETKAAIMKNAMLIGLLLVISISATAESAEVQKPNIVFVLFDDMGWGQPPSYAPDSALATPNFDRLASEGMRFTDAHSASAVCTPTRYGLLTGRYPSRIGQFGVLQTWSKPIIPTERLTIASLLKQQGYQTACVGKWHLGLTWEGSNHKGIPPVGKRYREGPNDLGFDYFCGFTHAGGIRTILEQDRVIAHIEESENQPLMLQKAVAWLEKQDPKEPFFLYFPMCPPHYPVAPSEEYLGKSGGVDIAGRELKGPHNPQLYPDWLYQGDAMLGKIMQVLEEQGLAENTLLIATSDNGAEHRAYAPLRDSKRSIYEGGHRVPFVARWPNQVRAGANWDHPICLNDLMATAAQITGVTLPATAGEDSVSFLPALSGTTDSPTREGTIHQSMAGDLALRKGPWKLIYKKAGNRELYNLASDLGETSNRLESNTEVVENLDKLMQRYIHEGRSTPGPMQKNEFELSAVLKPSHPKIVAHRGLTKQAPENTLTNFQACLERGMGFEFDVQQTKDGELVCIHDGDLDRTTNGSGKANLLTLKELRQLDAGSWFDPKFTGEKVPTIEEIFQLLSNYSHPEVLVAVDLKTEGVEETIVKLAEKHGVLGQLLFIGNTISAPEVRASLRKGSPQVHTAALANNESEFTDALQAADADWVYLRFLPSKAQMEAIHQAGKLAFIAGVTVGGHLPDNWHQAANAGIDAILTDYPQELENLLQNK
ncbi:MAG: sulfatase-like hydrolase/transferase [Planctomycetaceae bacterium]|nr:sulfatase-like hydrolase/transferase [Planctomycetaceae bacterium]